MANRVLDQNVRVALHAYLRKGLARDPSCALIDELTLHSGDGRIDVTVVNSYLHAYEIKSDADSLSRLPRQIALYGSVMDFLSVVVTDKHLAPAHARVPAWWGIYVYREHTVRELRAPQLNGLVDFARLSTLLWRDQSLALLRGKDVSGSVLKKPKRVLHKKLQEVCSKEEVHSAVCTQYREHRRVA